MSHNLPNGIPPQMDNVEGKTFNYALNGLGSSHSSRDSSPANSRFNQIPASQLPPSRSNIPSSQLPPSANQGSNITQLTKNYSHLTVSNGSNASKEVTPFSSPALQKFTTSTPTLDINKTLSVVPEMIQAANTTTSSYFDKSNITNFPHQIVQNTATKLLPVSSASYFSDTNVQSQGNSKGNNQHLDKQRENNKLPQSTASAVQSPLVNAVQGHLANVSLTESKLENVSTGSQQSTFTTIASNSRPSPTPLQQQYGIQATKYMQQPSVQQNIRPQQINTYTSISSKTPLQHNFSQQQMSNYNMPTQRNLPQQSMPLNQIQNNSGAYVSAPSISNSRTDCLKPSMAQDLASKNQNTTGNQPNYLVSSQSTFMPSTSSQNAYGQAPPLPSNNQQVFNPSSTLQPNSSSAYVPTTQSNMYQYGANAIKPPPTKSALHDNRYPAQTNQQINMSAPANQNYTQIPNIYQQQQRQQHNQNYQQTYNQSFAQSGFNKCWGTESYDLLQCPNILPPTKIEAPKVNLGQEMYDSVNCSPEIFRCTMTKIPESSTLLSKSRLPLGVLIHPFKDLYHLPVIQCNNIVRCRACRTYINPFVFFIDTKRWKCNICFRVNELPEEFQYDPVSKTYGDPSRRPEIKSSTIEYIAPAEYMLRPPQPAVYLFLLDVSRIAIESGYLQSFCSVLMSELNNLPGDARTQIGFLAYNSSLHFYSLVEGLSQPHEMVVLDTDDIFLPCPDNLLVNLHDRMELVTDLLTQLPTLFNNSYDNNSALGAALQVAHKMMAATGGRVTVFQAALPTVGPGALTAREDPSQRASTEIQHLNPANDFYKRLALECSGQQIAVDLFIINPQYIDLATISGISRFSGGCIYHFPLFKAERILQNTAFERSFRRYLTRKIGFEAVMRIRCTRGLSIHTFHGNFFVRSTDLLSLPNINPDSGFGMQVSIEESLTDMQTVCFQAALLYTSSKGERRIRVHTLCVPVTSLLVDVINSADQQCIIGLLAKMAVDRSMQSNISDAREAFINVAIDVLSTHKIIQNMNSGPTGLLAPQSLRLLPLYISAILKHVAFRIGTSTRLDDRVKAMCDMKVKPLPYLMQMIYPELYPIHNLEDHPTTIINEDEEPVPTPPHLQLTSRNIDSNGAYLMDTGEHMMIIVGSAINSTFLNQVLGVPDFNSITDNVFELPVLENPYNQRLHSFINYLNDDKPFVASLQIFKDNSPNRGAFLEKLIEDRIETALSYHEFLQHLKTQVK